MTHTVWAFSLSLLFVSLGIISNASIWAILFSVYLGQLMDIDMKGSSISKKIGLRSIGIFIRMFVKKHREETHSLFFSIITTIFLSPLAYIFSVADGSSFFSNLFIFFLGIFSHLILDFFNNQPVPVFYFPILNPISKAKKYSLKNITKGKFWGLDVGSEQEFKIVTLPLLFISILIIYFDFDLFKYKIIEGSNLIVNNIGLTLILCIYVLKDNYFIRKGWFKDFLYSIYGAFKEGGKLSYIKFDYLKNILWESNFTTALISLLLLFSIWFNSQEFINNVWGLISKTVINFELLKQNHFSISGISQFIFSTLKNIFF